MRAFQHFTVEGAFDLSYFTIGEMFDADKATTGGVQRSEHLVELGLNCGAVRFWLFWIRNTARKVRTVVPVLITGAN